MEAPLPCSLEPRKPRYEWQGWWGFALLAVIVAGIFIIATTFHTSTPAASTQATCTPATCTPAWIANSVVGNEISNGLGDDEHKTVKGVTPSTGWIRGSNGSNHFDATAIDSSGETFSITVTLFSDGTVGWHST
jgi:hypothetical protein